MEREQARAHWNDAAPGWAEWEPAIGRWVGRSTQAMLDAAGVVAGAHVVDIACGAGDQSLAAARRVGDGGSVLATDISEEMIGFVERRAREAGIANVSTRCCAAEELDGGGTLFDAAICRVGLMLIPDPGSAVRAICRVLRPGGRLGAVVFSSPAANPYMSEPLKILRRHANKAPPAGGPGIFALADTAVLTELLEDGGFEDIRIATIDETLEMGSADDALRMMRDAFGVYRATIGDQPPEVQRAAWHEVLGFLKSFEGDDGFRISGQFHVAGAVKPGAEPARPETRR